MAIVPITSGIDIRSVLVDTTGAALGTAGNPLVTAAGGGGGSVFPAAAAISDGTANPTVTEIETFPMAWNGANWNRQQSVTQFLAGLTPSSGAAGTLAAGSIVYDATADSLVIQRTLHSFGDGIQGGTTVGVGPFIWNGATWDRVRAVATATGTVGTGLLGAGILGFDGTNYIRLSAPAAGSAVASTGNPLQIGLSDGTNARNLKGNTDGTLPVGGFTTSVSVTLTRPANTTTYTANTAIANAASGAVEIAFSNCARFNGGSGMIHAAWLLDEANQATKAQLELWLYDTAIGTVINDDANWTPALADLANLVGIINFGSNPTVGNNAAGASGNCVYTATGLNLPFKCAPGTTSLHGQLVVRNAYVPVNSEVFVIRLEIGQD